MMAKPMKTLELYYPMIQFLLTKISQWAEQCSHYYGKSIVFPGNILWVI